MREWFDWVASQPDDPASTCRMYASEAIPDDPPRRYAEEDPKGYELPKCPPESWWPLPNVWLGVSVESQEYVHRVADLLNTPAAVRFLSCEPLLGPLDIRSLTGCKRPLEPRDCACWPAGLHWVIVGGESGRGPGIRPMHPEWARSLRDQCSAAGVPFFFKQWGEWAPRGIVGGGSQRGDERGRELWMDPDGSTRADDPENAEPWTEAGARSFAASGQALMRRVGKKKAGALLDGVEHKAFPGGACVR